MQPSRSRFLLFRLEASPTCGAGSCWWSDWECVRCLAISASLPSLLLIPTDGEFSGSGGRCLELGALNYRIKIKVNEGSWADNEGKRFWHLRHLLCAHRGPLLSSSACADGTRTAQRKRKEDEKEACCFLKALKAALGCEAPDTESECLDLPYELFYI